MCLLVNIEMGNIRVRIVEYSPGYTADHWCNKGHVLLVLEGELYTELSDGSKVRLTLNGQILLRICLFFLL